MHLIFPAADCQSMGEVAERLKAVKGVNSPIFTTLANISTVFVGSNPTLARLIDSK